MNGYSSLSLFFFTGSITQQKTLHVNVKFPNFSTPSSRWQRYPLTANYGQMQAHAWSTTNEFATTVDRELYLHQQYKAKGIVPFPYVMLAAC